MLEKDMTIPMQQGTDPSLGDSLIADVDPPRQMRPDALVDPLIGARLGNYEILFVLGRGSYGSVYKARDVKLGRDVAIKFLHEFLDTRHEAMFLREAKAIAALSKHPAIVQIYEWSEHQGRNYFVLEFVGSNAAMLLRVNPQGLPFERAARIVLDCAEGLVFAHKQGIIHRDIKPANILLEIDGSHAKLADFGVARFFDPSGGSMSDVPGGTPGYMAPEIVRGSEGDDRSDIFSLGSTLYELLCGRIPFEGNNAYEIMDQIRNARRIPLWDRRTDIPDALMRIVERALAHDPEHRFQKAEEFAEALQFYLKSVQPAAARIEGAGVTEEDVAIAKTHAFKAAEDAKQAGAEKLAHTFLTKGVGAFRDAEAYERLKLWKEAKGAFESAEGLFTEADRRSSHVMAEIRALKTAQTLMEQARRQAEESDAPTLAAAAFAQAEQEDQNARKATGLQEAMRVYEIARDRYAFAHAEAIKQGAALLIEPRKTLDRLRLNAKTLCADQYAPQDLAAAETLADQAAAALPDFKEAQRLYLAAIDRFREAVRITLEQKRLESERQSRQPLHVAHVEFVWIPPGRFTMGSGTGSPEERPSHTVEFSNGFWIAKYPITQEQWVSIMNQNPSGFRGDDQLPVENVSWDDCQTFISRLNALGEGEFRLPTEAEWEYACRAGNESDWCFGANRDKLDDYAWNPANAGGRTHPVGRKHPNAWGLYDMHGNVCEWCQDHWHLNYEGAPADGSAWLSAPGDPHVARGGSWCVVASDCRSSARSWYAPRDARTDFMGLRICRNK